MLGANGSGKSTLAKVLTGVYQPEQGEIVVGAARVGRITSPSHANELGIAVVHQEAPLIDSMTVSEGMALFRGYPTAGGRVQWNRLREETSAMLRAFDVDVDPDRLAGTLSPAERALVAMVIALDQVKSGLQLLILDEVTASLPERQAATFLDRVAAVARAGTAVLMVTHRLAELQGRADTVTVLRNGKVVHSAPADAVDHKTLVATMVGAHQGPVPTEEAPRRDIVSRLWATVSRSGPRSEGQAPVLQARNLAGRFMRDVSFDIRRGEIVGVAGLIEGGINELPQVLGGTVPRRGGTLRVGERELPRRMTPRAALRAGLALLPVDRLRSGGIGTLDLTENVLLPELGSFWHARSRERRVMEEIIACFDVRPPDPRALFGRLSGGNQQKILLGKWLLMRPSVLILEDPTSGVDPNARSKMFEAIADAARQGVSILFFSTEPEQLAAMCTRVLVLRDGVVARELTGDDLDQAIISQWSYS
ncbi:ribose transport system ATP-binding protein [Labrys monachus]|uniref:Ribose transport system ATP-binding protein n=1 Tax=Labrys monachus TaxID=217067 RepID=A0ABU0F8I5_9HYPH|nr:ribose transport system ATP-binding protein [Labrys monachus]